MGLVGSNIFGHETLAEIRVNAAQDLAVPCKDLALEEK